MMNIKRYHYPVMVTEVVENLDVVQGGRYIDGTLGEGGHTEAILEISQPGGQVLGIDADHEAIIISKKRLERFSDCSFFSNSKFSEMKDIASEINFIPVHGILLDLGISSLQLDFEDRGFSFSRDSKLDMRFSLDSELNASKIVNDYSEKSLSELIYKYSEDPNSRRIAAAICDNRPIFSSTELAKIIESANLKVRRKHHPATLTFQALRIAVNSEIKELESVLLDSLTLLGIGGRLAVISYHSLEDRIVKNFIKKGVAKCSCPPLNLECTCSTEPYIKIINKKPITPSETEIASNPRSRSAKMRTIERIR
ncbi:MAG: 16S rRNA (cytosine(1402)-N(4))-methyltransferase [Chloroflexi bacterium]|nr:16S rRNA (cytosine(1402)-N(4))-methyltransferase [Chloroflexota bacterium]|tara:strand:- start:9317 stop:10249 length:933 start_codon:yes stop_codon:yes gene_type:complete